MWLVDHQMNQLVSVAFGQYYARLPLRKSPTIRHGNAPQDCIGMRCFQGSSVRFRTWQSAVHRKEAAEMRNGRRTCPDLRGCPGRWRLDYVCCWYARAARNIIDPGWPSSPATPSAAEAATWLHKFVPAGGRHHLVESTGDRTSARSSGRETGRQLQTPPACRAVSEEPRLKSGTPCCPQSIPGHVCGNWATNCRVATPKLLKTAVEKQIRLASMISTLPSTSQRQTSQKEADNRPRRIAAVSAWTMASDQRRFRSGWSRIKKGKTHDVGRWCRAIFAERRFCGIRSAATAAVRLAVHRIPAPQRHEQVAKQTSFTVAQARAAADAVWPSIRARATGSASSAATALGPQVIRRSIRAGQCRRRFKHEPQPFAHLDHEIEQLLVPFAFWNRCHATPQQPRRIERPQASPARPDRAKSTAPTSPRQSRTFPTRRRRHDEMQQHRRAVGFLADPNSQADFLRQIDPGVVALARGVPSGAQSTSGT